jgi:predicted DNA binding CopG/RHH family protein
MLKYKDHSGRTITLNDEEAELLKVIESAKYTIADVEQVKNYNNIFRSHAKKNKVLNIRISEEDLNDIKSRAKQSGVPYQTLIGILLHQFAKNKIDVQV